MNKRLITQDNTNPELKKFRIFFWYKSFIDILVKKNNRVVDQLVGRLIWDEDIVQVRVLSTRLIVKISFGQNLTLRQICIFISMENIIKTSKTKSEAIKKMFGYDNGSNRKKFELFVNENGINIEHLRSRELIYERILKDCPVCNKSFETSIGNRDEKFTCSHSCSNTYFRSGENNPNWGKYSETKNGYRRLCFEYHKQECVVCGENKIVAVHHYDENHNNNLLDNLIPLCPTHHQYVHSRYKNEVLPIIEEYRNKFKKI